MKRLAFCAALLFSSTLLFAGESKRGLQITFDSDDSRTQFTERRDVRDARAAITTRDGSTSLLLMNDVVAIQLTDRAIENIHSDDKGGFFEELVASGVRVAMRRSVAYPIANLRSVEVRNGEIVLLNNENKAVFTNVKVNGTEVMRDFSAGDAARFVQAFRTVKAQR
jgi:hypothetical protein